MHPVADDSIIHWTLSLNASQRLTLAQDYVNFILGHPNPNGPLDPRRILLAFISHRVDFILTGQIAAAIHDQGERPYPIELLVSAHAANLAHLDDALSELEARPRPSSPRIPGYSHLTTRHGALNLTTRLPSGETFESLIVRAELRELGTGARYHTLNRDAALRLAHPALL